MPNQPLKSAIARCHLPRRAVPANRASNSIESDPLMTLLIIINPYSHARELILFSSSNITFIKCFAVLLSSST
jgi:hypothetical protein